MKKKYAFYCSGSASRIIKFYSLYNEIDYPVSFVYYDGGKIEVIEKLNIIFPNKLITPISRNVFLDKKISDILLYLLLEYKVDYLFCFGNKILKPNLIDIYKNKIINFHPSILPSFPGINAIDQALQTSVQVLGNTAHFIDSGVDTGPIIMQSVISRMLFQDYEDVLSLQIPMLKTIWYLLDNDKIMVNDEFVTFKTDYIGESFYSV